MPATWTGVVQRNPELIQRYGANPDPSGRYDPIPALYASAAHMRELLNDYGDYGQALGAYNAGGGGRNSAAARHYVNLVMGRVQ
jgi:hypothetical protein